MSGGHFNYQQYRLHDMAESISELIESNESEEKDVFGDKVGHFYSDNTIAKLKMTERTLRIAEAMVQRVDWLVSGDDGEEDFHKRWYNEISKLQLRY